MNIEAKVLYYTCDHFKFESMLGEAVSLETDMKRVWSEEPVQPTWVQKELQDISDVQRYLKNKLGKE